MNQKKAILEAIAALVQGESSSDLKEELSEEEMAEFLIGCIGLTNPFVYQSGKPYVVLKKKGKFYNGTSYYTRSQYSGYLSDITGTSFCLVYNTKDREIVESTNLEPTYNEFRKSFNDILNKLKENVND